MENSVITAPEGATYLGSDWMPVIPTNCVFDKGVTGCGATTLAIKQPGHTILAMPYQGLVDNKVASNPELLGIHGNIGIPREVAIAKYVKKHDTIKIATTYDSLPVVCDTLLSLGHNPYEDMFLFVDEWHVLFNSYKFRDATRELLERAKEFATKTYVSATPIPREFWLKELADLPECKLVWPNAKIPRMNSISMADPLDYMARLCKAHLTDDDGEHYHIFLNSVAGITRIIRLAGLAPKDCRIVCSQSESAKNKNQEKLPEGFQIASTLDPVRLFNFYTATCFEGQDIYDVNGRTFIISEKYKDHTKVDIRTTLPQICGRIRDSRFNGEINQFYAVSPYKDVSQEEFRETVFKEFEIARKDAEQFNSINVSPEGKAVLLQHASERKYLIVDKDDKIVADENLAFFDIVNYGIINGQYSSRYNMNTNLEEAGFKVSNDATGYKLAEELENCSVQNVTRRPFKEVFEKYCVLKTEPGTYDLSMSVNRIEQDKPLVKEAYEVLGPEKVRQMKYNQSNIKRELVKVAHEKFDKKVFMLLNGQIKRGVAIPRTEIKEKLDGIYKSLGSNQKAKATDLQKWYYVKETTKRGDDGKLIACLAIVSAKYKVPKQNN